ncbi:MAG: purine-nucleoside phosphorylase [Candidatus Bipolaricaulota bacterium]|nr:purine-nucleoside phosphorylase [Candidatus Bipolaricaulota bacterium]MDW8126733.1 purine-nucleoside phosphorylase [Candidatus Bipolaricaulota bacterium]
MEYVARLKEAAQAIKELGSPKVAVILGSGLSGILTLAGERRRKFLEIPGFPRPTVEGHVGEVAVGTLGGKEVLIQRGRIHYYEGYDPADLVFPVRAYALAGVKILVITNAAGGIRYGFFPGDIVLISDHINFLGVNPLRGPNLPELGPRFPDMSQAYDPALRKLAREVGAELGISLKEGVYLAALGPSYETPAEIRAFRAWGADLVGMSTVPEVIAARHAGMQVLGISVVTNFAAGVSPRPLSHEEVLAVTQNKAAELGRLLSALIPRLPA